MKILKKYWVLIITAVLLIITACRIIYVNVTYPSGKIKYINVDDDMNYKNISANRTGRVILPDKILKQKRKLINYCMDMLITVSIHLIMTTTLIIIHMMIIMFLHSI